MCYIQRFIKHFSYHRYENRSKSVHVQKPGRLHRRVEDTDAGGAEGAGGGAVHEAGSGAAKIRV